MRNLTRALLLALPLSALAAGEPPTQLALPDLPSTYRLFSPDTPVLGVLPKDAPPIRIYGIGDRGKLNVVRDDPRLRSSMPACFFATCPAVTCADAAVPPGECCPRCPSGRYGGPVGGKRTVPVR
jgi:hypothetical protein